MDRESSPSFVIGELFLDLLFRHLVSRPHATDPVVTLFQAPGNGKAVGHAPVPRDGRVREAVPRAQGVGGGGAGRGGEGDEYDLHEYAFCHGP